MCACVHTWVWICARPPLAGARAHTHTCKQRRLRCQLVEEGEGGREGGRRGDGRARGACGGGSRRGPEMANTEVPGSRQSHVYVCIHVNLSARIYVCVCIRTPCKPRDRHTHAVRRAGMSTAQHRRRWRDRRCACAASRVYGSVHSNSAASRVEAAESFSGVWVRALAASVHSRRPCINGVRAFTASVH